MCLLFMILILPVLTHLLFSRVKLDPLVPTVPLVLAAVP